MNIKLNARLSAYSKLESVSQANTTRVPEEVIDTLFDPNNSDSIVSKGDINTLFKDQELDKVVDKSAIDSLFTSDVSNTRRVSYAEIDSLFD